MIITIIIVTINNNGLLSQLQYLNIIPADISTRNWQLPYLDTHMFSIDKHSVIHIPAPEVCYKIKIPLTRMPRFWKILKENVLEYTGLFVRKMFVSKDGSCSTDISTDTFRLFHKGGILLAITATLPPSVLSVMRITCHCVTEWRNSTLAIIYRYCRYQATSQWRVTRVSLKEKWPWRAADNSPTSTAKINLLAPEFGI
jgi:hypothetical protein